MGTTYRSSGTSKTSSKRKMTMTMVGDIMMGRNVKEIVDRYGTDYVLDMFRHI